jgi:hypothetical protein
MNRTRPPSSFAWWVPLLGLLPLGCYESRHHHDYVVVPADETPPATCLPPSGVAAQSPIDTGVGIASDPAHPGAGVFIEYAAGGHWHVTTVCDTAVSGEGCSFNIDGQVLNGTVANVLGDALEPYDFAAITCADIATLSVVTYADSDGTWFDAPPGATVRFTAWLGNQPTNFLNWMSGGAPAFPATAGAIDLVPTAP